MSKKVGVSADGRSVVTKGSGGTAVSTLPDVCGIPGPNGTIYIPFVNVCKSEDLVGGSVTVKFGGEPVAVMGSKISKSTGNEAGILGGINSGVTCGEGVFLTGSSTVFVEGKPVIRKGDLMLMNKGNTISLSGMMQDDIEGVEGKDWMKLKIMEEDGSDYPKKPVGGVKVIVTMPDGSKEEKESAPNGIVNLLDLDSGTCSVELNEPEGSTVIEITDRRPSSNLPTKQCHIITVKIERLSGLGI